ncbi:MAG TPA: histidinol-phosphate transaminase [Burkholderiales bacterium]|jgi:histidinol-phosphate aminotransferase|nr:histidinol-phosphate transaminase [Burkholderiales bacterium]
MNTVSSLQGIVDVCERSPSYVRAIAPYLPGKPISELARELGLKEESIIKLASNENPLGASPKALAAMRATLDEVARYPDGNGFGLRMALARMYGVAAERIVLGNGSNDVLEMAANAFLAPGASAVYSQHAFAVYPLATQATGAAGVEVPARDFGHDLDAMARAVRGDTRVVFVANPNNPTGTWLAPEALRAFLRKLPADVLLVLDEAYYEYLDPGLRGDSPKWLEHFPNLVISRTFSKAYGLAGLRVGFAFAHPQVADLMNRVRQPFNVSSIAQAAAVAALADQDFVHRSRALNSQGMQVLTNGFKRLGLSWIPSYANFVSFKVQKAAEVFQRLLRQGVIVRPIAGYGMPEYLRVTVGTEPENARFLAALEAVLTDLR